MIKAYRISGYISSKTNFISAVIIPQCVLGKAFHTSPECSLILILYTACYSYPRALCREIRLFYQLGIASAQSGIKLPEESIVIILTFSNLPIKYQIKGVPTINEPGFQVERPLGRAKGIKSLFEKAYLVAIFIVRGAYFILLLVKMFVKSILELVT